MGVAALSGTRSVIAVTGDNVMPTGQCPRSGVADVGYMMAKPRRRSRLVQVALAALAHCDRSRRAAMPSQYQPRSATLVTADQSKTCISAVKCR
jgi:hypothetical protein